jgi:hypothetical protein
MLIISSDSNMLTILNDTGARVWELLGEELSIEEIAAVICLEFACSEPTARSDVETFVGEMRKRGFLREAAGAPS